MGLSDTDIDVSLLLKYVRGNADMAERRLVEEWAGDDAERCQMLKHIAMMYHADRTRRRIAARDPYKALRAVRRKMWWHRYRTAVIGAAAAASFLFGVADISLALYSGKASGGGEDFITMSTNAGMRSSFSLPDGTVVHLNAGSTLKYPAVYDRKERRVELDGEAYFNVVHDERHPFVVDTPGSKVNIRVLGTDFNLQAYGRDSVVQATLVNGRILYSVDGGQSDLVMKPSDMVTYDLRSGNTCRETVDAERVISWIDGRFIFRDTPLPDVLKQLSHYYSVDFRVQDEAVARYVFTGKFEDAPLMQVLDYLEMTSDIEYERQDSEEQHFIRIRSKS